ncbi:MAG: YfiR family protein [Spirochaetota bacterium]|nr:YfiR family protein [Spirochaetota bacterium]
MKGKPFRFITLIIICILTLNLQALYARSPSYNEYLVKAAFLYNIAKFIDWSPKAFKNDQSDIVLHIIGEDTFGNAINSIRGKTINGRKLVIKRSRSLQEFEKCHILFISKSEKDNLEPIFAKLQGLEVLTISDMSNFTRYGGIINLKTIKGKIHIEINVLRSELAGIKISSRLLKLARIVKY